MSNSPFLREGLQSANFDIHCQMSQPVPPVFLVPGPSWMVQFRGMTLFSYSKISPNGQKKKQKVAEVAEDEEVIMVD